MPTRKAGDYSTAPLAYTGAMTGDLKQDLIAEAHALGFADIGFARPDIGAAGDGLGAWVATGNHGAMGWMAERMAWRSDPAALWPEAQSVIMLAETYAPDSDPMASLARRDRAAISVYAKNRDYHDVVKKRLKRLGRWLIERTRRDGEAAQIKVFVDTAPVMEKPLGQQAGLGWQGKHTNLVSRQLGSWFFLGAIFTTVDLAPDASTADHCGGCRRCLDICPTAAFPAPYRLDARRCISYLTIELKDPIPREMRAAMGNRIYGCDDCLAVCPWNKFAQAGAEVYAARPETDDPPLADLVMLDDAAFRARFRASPIKRIGRARFIRNVLIAIGNSGDTTLAGAAAGLLHDGEPLVRGAAVWALSRLTSPETLAGYARDDPDPDVAAEWAAALGPDAPVSEL